MPGLVGRTGIGNIEAYLYDLVVGSKDGLRYGDNPWVRHQVHEAAHIFGVYLDVVALWASAHCSAGALERFFVEAEYLCMHGLHPIAVERAFEADNAVTIEAAHYCCNVVLLGPGQRVYAHDILLIAGYGPGGRAMLSCVPSCKV